MGIEEQIDDIYIFDYEVFAYDWLFTAKSVTTGEYTSFWNDNDAMRAFMEDDPFIGGFNNKHYDDHILKGILIGCNPEQIKMINDNIIVDGMQGWDIPLLKNFVFTQRLHTFDLRDDCQEGISLKSIEAHLGMNIEESSVDFTIDRPLTDAERREVERYCRCDVDATEILYRIRQGYLINKLNLARACGMDVRDGIHMTNAKLTAAYLHARKPEKPWTDEREYVYPDKLKKEYIPPEVFEYFDQLHDKSLTDDFVFSDKIIIKVGKCEVTIGFGGIHGALPHYIEESTETRTIRNKDVASYYPHLVSLPLMDGKIHGYCSRAIPDPQIYIDVLKSRIEDKKAGNKASADAKKLVLNTTYGAMLNQWNDLYDPLMGRSVCITGQLLLLELAEHLVKDCKTLKIIQLNTDGIMVSFDNSDEEKWQEITQEWQDRTGFTLEEDIIQKIIQKDVNNYIEIPKEGKYKIKGGVLVRGVLTNGQLDFEKMGLHAWDNLSGGAWMLNNNATVIAKAILEYYINGIPVEETIQHDDDILHYQLIAKAGSKYKASYHKVNGEWVQVQNVNRVYATHMPQYETIYKVHRKDNKWSKIAGLPASCYVDNKNEHGIEVVDKDWYIWQAKKYIDDFAGIKPPKVNTRKINSLKKEMEGILDEL